jgi:hypothetical protein
LASQTVSERARQTAETPKVKLEMIILALFVEDEEHPKKYLPESRLQVEIAGTAAALPHLQEVAHVSDNFILS